MTSIDRDGEQQTPQMDTAVYNTSTGCKKDSLKPSDSLPHSPVSRLLYSVGDETFRDASEVMTDTHVDAADSTYDSDTCDQMSGTSDSVKTYRPKKSYECFVCHQMFTHSSSLARHTLIHSGIKRYTCTTCNKSFAQPGHLDIHRRTHTGEKPYKCEICSKAFVDSTHLARHRRVHDDEKCYPCDVCPKSFRQLGTLNIHKRTHTGQKPYTCDVCDKGFVDSTHLTIHKRNHTGERPYVCGTCNKAFMNSSHLNRHKRLHLDNKPPTCDVCGKTFAKRTSLTMHKRIHSRAKLTTAAKCPTADRPPTHLSPPASVTGRDICTNTAPTAAIPAVQSPPRPLMGPVISPFTSVFPMMRLPAFDVNSALLRLPNLSKLVQRRDAAK